MRRLFEGGVLFCPPRRTSAKPSPQHSCELCPRPLGSHMMADELAQFSFLLLSQSLYTILSHVGNVIVTVSSHLRMRIATVHMNRIQLNAATVQGWPPLRSARVLCGAYSRAAFIRGAAFIQGNTVLHPLVRVEYLLLA